MKSKRHLLYAAIAICALAGLTLFQGAKRSDPIFYVGGIQINEPDQTFWSATLKKAGMNTSEITIYARQAAWDSEYLWFDRRDTSAIAEIRAAKKNGLHVALILRVLLDYKFKPNKGLWHGMIMPKTDREVQRWFLHYGKFVNYWAKIAAREGVEIFCIGSEMRLAAATRPVTKMPELPEFYMNPEKIDAYKDELMAYENIIKPQHLWIRGHGSCRSLTEYLSLLTSANQAWARQVTFQGDSVENTLPKINQRRKLLNEQWTHLIKNARNHFSGAIGYAANFDNYQNIGFWNALDFIGINAYFKLRSEINAVDQDDLLDSFQNKWEKIFTEIDSFRNNIGLKTRPVIFTELGYTYRQLATIYPWTGADFAIVGTDSNKQMIILEEQPIDFQERTLAIRALRQTHKKFTEKHGTSLLRGVFYWKLSTQDYHLPYEPFMVLIDENHQDPAVSELRSFLEPFDQRGKVDVRAEAMNRRQKLFDALALDKWRNTHALQWQTQNSEFIADLQQGRLFVQQKQLKAWLNLKDSSGVVIQNGFRLKPQLADSILQTFAAEIEKALFMLTPIDFILSANVERKTITTREGEIALSIKSRNGDDFNIILNEEGLPRKWYFYPSGNNTVQSGEWLGWTTLNNGLKAASFHVSGQDTTWTRAAHAGNSLEEIQANNIFAEAPE